MTFAAIFRSSADVGSSRRSSSKSLAFVHIVALTDTQMKLLSPWNQDRPTSQRKPFYERSLQSYVGIAPLYVWIPRGIREAVVRLERAFSSFAVLLRHHARL